MQGSALVDGAPTSIVGTRGLGSFRVLWGGFINFNFKAPQLVPVTFVSLSLHMSIRHFRAGIGRRKKHKDWEKGFLSSNIL